MPMGKIVLICLVSLLAAGCRSPQAHQDSFVSLQNLIANKLAGDADCGPIVTNEVAGGRYFVVSPRPNGIPIDVVEKPYISQKEWDRRNAAETNAIANFMEFFKTNPPIDFSRPLDQKTKKKLLGLPNLLDLPDLPGWSYQKTGVDVYIEDRDVAYPGIEEDEAQSKRRYREIVQQLKPYDRLDCNKAIDKNP
jgi:hypothetical protein